LTPHISNALTAVFSSSWS